MQTLPSDAEPDPAVPSDAEPDPAVPSDAEPDPNVHTTTFIHPEDPDDVWVPERSGRSINVGAVTATLALLAILAGGFWGGVLAEKHHGTGSTATAASRLAAARAGLGTNATGSGAGGFALFGGRGGSAGAATAGVVTGVQGKTLFVTDSTGALVKVAVGPSVAITRTGSTSLGGLKTGDTVVVSGIKSNNGTITATSVRATAQGTQATSGAGVGGQTVPGGG